MQLDLQMMYNEIYRGVFKLYFLHVSFRYNLLLTVEIGGLKQDQKKEEENFGQEKLEGDLSFTLSNFFFTDSE